ncbi:dTDP-4-dehydrorhamnose 3,5-epimerase [compost metagenome]
MTSEFAEFQYKVTDYWCPEFERSICYNDPDLAIEWPSFADNTKFALSAKDVNGSQFKTAQHL